MKACFFVEAEVTRLQFDLRYAIYDLRVHFRPSRTSIVYRKSKIKSLLASAATIIPRGNFDEY